MGRSVRRIRLAAALTAAIGMLVGMLGAAPAHAVSPAAPDEYRGTTLEAGRPGLLGLTVSLQPTARLTDAETGEPLAGQVIDFHVGDTIWPTCSGVTNAKGVAKCGGLFVMLGVLQVGRNGYRATFSGAVVGDIGYRVSLDSTTFLGP